MSNDRPLQMFALVDGAIFPSKIQPLLEKSGQRFCSLFAGMPEEKLGPASPFLVHIEDAPAAWVEEINQLDLHTPCLSPLWSHFDIDELALHLKAFLFAEIGDGMTAMVRYFDPRCTAEVFRVWGDAIFKLFMSPIAQWMYRGRNKDWQTIKNDAAENGRICKTVVVEFSQKDVDQLTAYTEPDELMAALVGMGIADGKPPYIERLADFMPRYQRALHWEFSQPADRLEFCQLTYQHGLEFERHVSILETLKLRRESGESLGAAIERVPEGVWEMISQMRLASAASA